MAFAKNGVLTSLIRCIQIPPCDEFCLSVREQERFKQDLLYCPSAARKRCRLNGTDLDEYIQNARFLLAEHKTYEPDEVVGLTEQKVEVVIRSSFEESASGGDGASSSSSDTLPGQEQSTAASNDASEPAQAATADASESSTPTNPAATENQAATNDDVTQIRRTYVTESSTGQTINHVCHPDFHACFCALSHGITWFLWHRFDHMTFGNALFLKCTSILQYPLHD
mgnify:CR=1 FL=1